MSYVESFGGIIYYLDKDKTPKFLVVKRQALSKKIEWTAPKWKAQSGENPVETAKREVYEETNLDPDLLIEKGMLGDFMITFPDNSFVKKITYFLFEYKWNPNDVKISDTEWYIGVYNWLPIDKIINLISYKSLRELYRKAYLMILKDSQTSKTNQ